MSNTESANPFAMAMNLLAPFSNRIAGGFAYEGQQYQIPANLAGEPFAIHGDAFQREWVVTAQTDDKLKLLLRDGRIGPFRYRAEAQYWLCKSSLQASLCLTNTADLTLPYGLGFHPWFPRSELTTLKFSADSYWPEDERHLRATATSIALPQELDFSKSRPLPRSWLNVGFAGWSGRAMIRQAPEAVSVELVAEDLSTALLYAPNPEAEFFCFEPVSHPVDAHNLADQRDLIELRPGESMTRKMRIDWST